MYPQKREAALHKYRNIPYAGDSIVKQQMEYADPGAEGRQITWDFRSVRPVNDEYTLLYKSVSEDTSQIVGIEHHTIYRYQIRHDSLLHTGYENTTTFMEYTEPELQMKYSFRYGDTIRSHFKEIGEYCHRIPLNVEGNTTITADAVGTLYTPQGPEIKNLSFEQRAELRSRLSYPLMCAFENRILREYPEVLPKGRIGKALRYTYNIYHRLSRYHLDGRYRMDNNPVENTIRPVALGRLCCAQHNRPYVGIKIMLACVSKHLMVRVYSILLANINLLNYELDSKHAIARMQLLFRCC